MQLFRNAFGCCGRLSGVGPVGAEEANVQVGEGRGGQESQDLRHRASGQSWCQVTEWKCKDKDLTPSQISFNRLLQFYRGRVEHIIGEVKKHNTTGGRWRGSYELIQAIQKIVVHMTTLQERIKGPRYDVSSYSFLLGNSVFDIFCGNMVQKID